MKNIKALDIIKICEENSIYYNIYTEKEIIAKSLQCNVLYYYKENANKEEADKTHINIVENMYDYIANRDEKIIKITICDNNQAIFHSILRKLNEIGEIEVLEVSHMSRKMIRQGTEEIPIEYYYTEISAKDVDKWSAIEFLKEKMDIKTEEIIAIGDNINDKKMIENAGLGVAMGQSTPLIISGRANESSDLYKKANDFVKRLTPKVIVEEDVKDFEQAEDNEKYDYIVDLKAKSASLTQKGREKSNVNSIKI